MAIGDSKSAVTSAFGSPARTDSGEGGFSFLVYNKDYSNFLMVAVDTNNKVVGFFVCSNSLNYYGIDTNSKLAAVNSALGTSVSTSNSFYSNNGAVVTTKSSTDISVFIDHNGDGTVFAVYCMKSDVTYKAITSMTESALFAVEKQVLDITNAYRAQYGLSALTWSDKAANAGRDYCEVMADLDIFSHEADGSFFGDRLKDAGVSYRSAGENIAANGVTYGHYMGVSGGVGCVAGWIKSAGHRDNILNANFTHLGVGVVPDSAGEWSDYSAQEFYR